MILALGRFSQYLSCVVNDNSSVQADMQAAQGAPWPALYCAPRQRAASTPLCVAQGVILPRALCRGKYCDLTSIDLSRSLVHLPFVEIHACNCTIHCCLDKFVDLQSASHDGCYEPISMVDASRRAATRPLRVAARRGSRHGSDASDASLRRPLPPVPGPPTEICKVVAQNLLD